MNVGCSNSFNGEFKKQSSGGAIGNILTGALAAAFMAVWAREFKSVLANATSEITAFRQFLLKIYVDDGNHVMTTLPAGSRLINGKIKIVDEEIENDLEIPGDQRTANIITELANTICPFIKLTVDAPSCNASGWMLILDIQAKV